MKLKTIAVAAVAAAFLGTAGHAQQLDPKTQALVQELIDAGYAHIEVQRTRTGVNIEAIGDMGKIERVYDLDGTLRKEEVTENGKQVERTFDRNGKLVKQEVGDDSGYDSQDDEGVNEDDGKDDHSAESDDDGVDDHGNDDSNDDHGDDHGDDHDDDHEDDHEDD